jgi:hypothetical protein
MKLFILRFGIGGIFVLAVKLPLFLHEFSIVRIAGVVILEIFVGAPHKTLQNVKHYPRQAHYRKHYEKIRILVIFDPLSRRPFSNLFRVHFFLKILSFLTSIS